MTHHNLALYTSHDANVAWRSHDSAYHVLELERIAGQRYYSLDTDSQWASQFSHAARWFSRRDPYLCLFPNDDVRQWMLGVGERICGHHDAHAACAFYQSPFDEALVLSYDGGGPDMDGRTVHFAVYKGTRTSGLERLYVADNLDLGTRYRDAAGYVPEVATPGSNPMTWPGKSMALAAFGEPTRLDEALGYLQGNVKPDPSQNDANWLASVQLALEGIVYRHIMKSGDASNLCLTGGCALNVKVNQRLHDLGYNVYVPPNPSDCGLSLGMLLWQDRPSKPVNVLFNGHDYLSNVLAPTNVSSTLKEVASLLAQGKVVGFVHGRPEVGPRALGHRSILAADIPGMRDRLNRIKGRASYRPVAPMARSVHVYALFDLPHSATMSFAPRARYKGESVHVDGTSRLQCVTEADNPLMWELLTYYEATSPLLPLLLNTSLNQRGRPLVGSLSNAFSCLQDLDALYVNGTLHKR